MNLAAVIPGPIAAGVHRAGENRRLGLRRQWPSESEQQGHNHANRQHCQDQDMLPGHWASFSIQDRFMQFGESLTN
jgi:hypothetical protein